MLRILRDATLGLLVSAVSACASDPAGPKAGGSQADGAEAGDADSRVCPIPCEGTCADGRCLVTLADASSPDDLAVEGTSVYFAGCASTGTGGAASSVPIAGGPSVLLASGPACPASIALGALGLYVSGLNGGDIARVPRDGGPLTVISSNPDKPTGLAIDTRNVYWATRGGALMRMPLSGGPPTAIASCHNGCTRPVVQGDDVYWGDSTAGSIFKLSADGGPPIPVTGGLEAVGAIAVSSDRIYFSSGYLLGQVPMDGGTAMSLGLPTGAPVGAIAVDDTSVYFTSWGSIWKIAFADIQPTQIATNQGDPNAIAVDGTSVYWTNADAWPDGGCCGQVMKLTPK